MFVHFKGLIYIIQNHFSNTAMDSFCPILQTYFVDIHEIKRPINKKFIISLNFKSKVNYHSKISFLIKFFGLNKFYNRLGSSYSRLHKYCRFNDIKILIIALSVSKNNLKIAMINVKNQTSIVMKVLTDYIRNQKIENIKISFDYFILFQTIKTSYNIIKLFFVPFFTLKKLLSENLLIFSNYNKLLIVKVLRFRLIEVIGVNIRSIKVKVEENVMDYGFIFKFLKLWL
uniref:Uncharacterized protein n=1 Tax=Amorphochlora amoebiformis TaxID=1561963 RepID=A0A0H5BIJ7_9EUKA|nr:hypothetical protein [Amorphochlora amoebiformis]